MDLDEIKKHWDNLSEIFAKDLKSTTKTGTIKKLEINAITRCIHSLLNSNQNISSVLEVGCGNGHNLIALTNQFPTIKFTGVDYSENMIKNATQLKDDYSLPNLEYRMGDILDLKSSGVAGEFDLVFTNRCIINLNKPELHLEALSNLSKILRENGHILLIENSQKTYEKQNMCRTAIGLEQRTPDKYNLFLDEHAFLDYAQHKLKLELIMTQDFASLHDLMLYVLIPKINGGKVDYDHPLMTAVTELLLNMQHSQMDAFGDFGQNRLFLFRK